MENKYESQFIKLNSKSEIDYYIDDNEDLMASLDYWTDKMIEHYKKIYNCNEEKFLDDIYVNSTSYQNKYNTQK